MKKRASQPDDQEKADRAFFVLKNFIIENGEFDMPIWIAAMFSIIADRYAYSEITYDQYCKEMKKAAEHYKYKFE